MRLHGVRLIVWYNNNDSEEKGGSLLCLLVGY